MLYIASALTPTPILDSLRIEGFTSPSSTSLITAKPDRVEVWDVEPSGLTYKASLEVWGSVAGIEKVLIKDAVPHILVLLSPPNAQLLLLSYSSTSTPALVVTSSLPLTPPTPSLRQAEFLTGVFSQGSVALVSLWIGVLSCIEMEVEKEKDIKKRRASTAGAAVEDEGAGKRVKFRDNFNINIREHNLLHLSFLPATPSNPDPLLTFLWLSSHSSLQLQLRRLSLSSHAFTESSKSIDVVSPTRPTMDLSDTTDFNDVPFSCPAARRVLPIPTLGPTGEAYALVIGDEHSVLYSFHFSPQSPKASRMSLGTIGENTSPRGAATKRSPQNEMVGGAGKRRKSSLLSRMGGEDGGERWSVRPVWRVRQGFGTVLAASVLESHPTGASAVLSDECGRLSAMGWEFDRQQGILDSPEGQHGTVRVRKLNLGTASPASSLTYLANAHLFLSSSAGDSQLVRLSLPSPNSPSSPSSPSARAPRKGKSRAKKEDEDSLWAVEAHEDGPCVSEGKTRIEVKERWMNLAPVKDFVAVKEDDGGVSHLVVASGASNTNSLRVVRSGVGMENVLEVQGVEGVQRMWPLSIDGSTHLLLSTSTATILLALGPDVSQVDLPEDIAGQTVLAAHCKAGHVILARPSGVLVTSFTSAAAPVGWSVDKGEEVIAAAISGGFVALGKRGGEVVILSANGASLEVAVSFNLGSEISALAILSDPSLAAPIFALGTWTGQIHLLALSTILASPASPPLTPLAESAYPISLSLLPMPANDTSTGVQLLAGMSDGGMIIYELDTSAEGGGIDVKGRKASSLGARPLRVVDLPEGVDAEEKVIGVGLSERMSVVFESKGRIDFSSSSIKDIQAATSISHPIYGDVLVLASSTGLTFTKVNSLKKLSVQTLDMGERSAQKVAAVDDTGLLAVGVTERHLDKETGDIEQRGYLELRDSRDLQLYDEMALVEREEVTCLASVLLLGRQYIAVGTAIFASEDEYDEATYAGSAAVIHAREGRVLLVDAQRDADYKINVVATVKTQGPVHDLAVIHGFLAIAAASKVTINRLSPGPAPPTISELSAFASTFIAAHLHVVHDAFPEDRLVIGDGMRSVFVLDVDEGSGAILGDQRDLATYGVGAMASVRDGGGKEGVIISDASGNLLTFRLSPQLESHASLALHDTPVRFVPGSLAPASSAPDVLTPQLLFATQDGRLGIVGELRDGAGRTLDEVQRNMERNLKGPGGVGWKVWRKWAGVGEGGRDTAGWVDGDFVQKFMDAELLPSAEQDKVLSGTNAHERVSRAGLAGGREPADRGDVVRVLEAAAGLH